MRGVQTKVPKGKVVRERYIVEDLLGQGGFGAVYRVRDRRVKSNVFALKEVVDPNAHQRTSFAFECEILRRLDHFALPRVYRVFEDHKNKSVYMLMDYIEGPNLEKLRQQQPHQRFSLPQVLQIMAPIIEAVSYLHVQQPPIIHRDIKPSNIIVPSSGESAVLVDFGIAKEYDLNSTTTAVRHCSPGYGAPEQYVHGTSTQTDIYGLGATFYTLLTGEVPIDALYRITRMSGKGADPLALAHLRVSTIPVPVAEALQRAMAVNSQDRFATISEFWEVLKLYAVEEATTEAITTEVMPMKSALQSLPLSSREEDDVLFVTTLPPETCSAPETPLALSQPGSLSSASQTIFKRCSSVLFLGLTLLVLTAIGSGLLFGLVVLPVSKSTTAHLTRHRHTSIKVIAVAPKTAHLAPIPATMPVPTATTTPTPQPSPTSAAVTYPVLLTDYTGSIHNTPAVVDSTMSLSQIRQSQDSISGYFAVGAGLIGDGSFSGTITPDSKVQFTVSGHNGILPLFFQGRLHPDGSITGNYCSLQNDQCSYSGGGYGTWNVLSHPAQVQSSLPFTISILQAKLFAEHS